MKTESRNYYEAPVHDKIMYYQARLLCWQEHTDRQSLTWASFLLDDSRPNKEQLLNDKRRNQVYE